MNVNCKWCAAELGKVSIAGVEPGLQLRVYVQGCVFSGFQFGFTVDKATDDDWVFDTNGVKLLIDPMSGAYFKDATIDYKNDPLNGSMFIINNPNAKQTCGCGSSAAF